MSNIIEKPWGYYEDYFRGENVVFKKIVIKPGHKISYQIHQHREELWFIQSGMGLLKFSLDANPMVNYTVKEMAPGENIQIPIGVAHQLICHGEEDLVVFEMQFGPECSENDIERIEDPYKRN